MLCPLPEIMNDAAENHEGNYCKVVLELAIKLLCPYHKFPGTAEEYVASQHEVLDVFWEEYNQFTTKTGCFSNREHMWRSIDILQNRTHIWHKKNTLYSMRYLGSFVCLVTSKPMGIGAAERCWGEVKSIMGGQQLTLLAEKCSKLTTIEGRYQEEVFKMLKRRQGHTTTTGTRRRRTRILLD